SLVISQLTSEIFRKTRGKIMMRKLLDLDLGGKTVFVRVDFNVPIQDGKVGEPHRIDSALPTVRHILDRARKIVLASHLGRPDGKRNEKYSLAPVREYLQQRLGEPVALAPDCIGPEVQRVAARRAAGKSPLPQGRREKRRSVFARAGRPRRRLCGRRVRGGPSGARVDRGNGSVRQN